MTNSSLQTAKQNLSTAAKALSDFCFDDHSEYNDDYVDKCHEALKLLTEANRLIGD